MADIMSLIKEIMTLTSTVGGLKSDVEKLFSKVENHTERIVRLENREELLAEKMTNSAIKAVYEMNTQYFDRLVALEQRVGFPPGPQQKRLEG